MNTASMTMKLFLGICYTLRLQYYKRWTIFWRNQVIMGTINSKRHEFFYQEIKIVIIGKINFPYY